MLKKVDHLAQSHVKEMPEREYNSFMYLTPSLLIPISCLSPVFKQTINSYLSMKLKN